MKKILLLSVVALASQVATAQHKTAYPNTVEKETKTVNLNKDSHLEDEQSTYKKNGTIEDSNNPTKNGAVKTTINGKTAYIKKNNRITVIYTPKSSK